jgi:hypothetical protein
MMAADRTARRIPIQPFAWGARHMPRISFSVVVCLLRSAVGPVATFLSSTLSSMLDGPVGRYRPEDHYMRGPGPKWREKHFLDRASAGGG